jgi:hypothetical protein
MKNKKRVIGAIIILALITIVSIAGYTFARYYKSINVGGGSATIARWSFGSKNISTDINLSDEKIAPGSSGEFEIEVDATNSEVPVEYEILVSEEKNIPTNMNFFAEIKNEQNTTLSTTATYSSFEGLASDALKGTIPVEKNNQKRIVVVHWNWEFNDDDTSSVDATDATLVLDENGKSNLECGFNIQIIGRQAKTN